MKLYIIRHGETFGNLNGDGFSETDLTPKGERQIALLGERFKEESIDRVAISYKTDLTGTVVLKLPVIKPNTTVPVVEIFLK